LEELKSRYYHIKALMSSSQSKEGEDESMEESKHYGDVFIQKERARRLRSEWLFKRRVSLVH
jgi:hypothetical protein